MNAKDDTPPGPDFSVCVHANLRRAMRAVGQVYDAALKPSGLKATQFTLLAVVAGHEGMPMTRLAELMVLDRTTLTRNLKPLVQQGLIQIGRQKDERIRLVTATDAGKRKVAEVAPLWQQAQDRVAGQFDAVQLGHVLGALDTLVTRTANP